MVPTTRAKTMITQVSYAVVVEWVGVESWSGMEWSGFQWSMIILKRAGQPGQQMAVFFSKMDFTRAQLGQQISNDKDNDQQDVSHLAFFPNSRRLIRLFVFRTFCWGRFWSILRFWLKNITK